MVRKRTDRELIEGKRQEGLKNALSSIWLARGVQYGHQREGRNDITTHAKKAATVKFLSAVRVGFLKNSILFLNTNNEGQVGAASTILIFLCIATQLE